MTCVRPMLALASLLACSLLASASAHAGPTLDAIRSAGTVTCAVVTDVDDYSEIDSHGNLSALEADFCHALAAEIFGDAARALLLSRPDEQTGIIAVRDKQASVLFGATPNPLIGNAFGVSFGPPIFFDGQGFLVAKDKGITTLDNLSGRDVCFINASPAERTLYTGLDPKLAKPEAHFPFTERGELEVALLDDHCDAMTGDMSWLANARLGFKRFASRFVMLPETISLDPLSPAYRSDDPDWAALIDWTVWSLLQAESYGITQANAAAMRDSKDVAVRRLLGTTPWLGKALGVSDAAMFNAIAAVGNYGEIYDRDVGDGSALKLPRGRNALASQGGLMWALPVETLQ